ncbi:unnamed protein product, partial [Rotaria sp. Silwood2]
MTLLQVIIILVVIISYSTAWQHYYNLYQTDSIHHDLSSDCIYHMIDNQQDLDSKIYKTKQLIEYCIRSNLKKEDDVIKGSISSILTFDQLKKDNVTVESLIKWSSPIDLIEHYQTFLEMNNSLSMKLFYNCTVPWFGPFCQYRFPLNQTFSNIVDITFNTKTKANFHGKFTCYMHIKCDRGSSLICLDWREICDGKIDCLDGGEDEKHCLELQINQCVDNEYQCRSGMCIDEAFLLETTINYLVSHECIDESDEPTKFGVRIHCLKDPSFRCEDTVCPYPNAFNCGDGNCAYWPVIQSSNRCKNNRDQVFNFRYNWHNEEDTRFPSCFKFAICSSNIFKPNEFDTYCKYLCENASKCKFNLGNCSSYFFAPDFPVWDGHVRLGYFSNQTLIKHTVGLPHFFCFNKHKCPFLIPTFEVDNYTCLHTHTLEFSSQADLYNVFISCIHLYESINDSSCTHSSMVNCLGTNKCIPKHHIMDGIPDCYNAFDESIASNSCSLNDKYRFHCTSENKCLSPTMVENDLYECIGGEDNSHSIGEIAHIRQLPFSALCDSTRDLSSSVNETDETHCEQWPCVNQYTRCNGVWNCPKGIDEINCPSKFNCPKDYHPCVFPKNQTVGCLHLNRTDDGIVDCLGATDERTLCRISYPTDGHLRYQCWNDSKCIDFSFRCSECKHLDGIEELCRHPDNEILDTLEYFQYMHDIYLVIKLPFSPQSSRPFPKKQILPFVDKDIQYQTFQTNALNRNDELDIRQAWLCHRGILIYYGKSESEQCLCPPSYYGDRCQYQNQRVSLTLRFHYENLDKLTALGMLITLVDNTGFIHSYEQFTYIPIHDCNTKFNIYLLYQDQPKDITKNYTVHIDAYDKINLIYLTSWTLPVKFLFMPVNRMSAQLTIPARHHCQILCNSIYHEQKRNNNIGSCQCELKKSEMIFSNHSNCNCSPDSICVGILNNRSICLCPLTKMSSRCFLKSICQNNTCMNRGLCVPYNDRISFTNFTCICQDGFSGKRCEHKDVKIDISFIDVPIPQSLLVHFITVRDYDLYSLDPAPVRATMFKKIGFDQDTVTFFMSLPFHLVFAQIETKFYLIVLQHNYTASVIIATEVARPTYCPHIQELFNESIINYPVLHRAKYYHLACMKHSNLVCFQDSEIFMCLCTEERHANCFHFDFNMTYNCRGSKICQNEAQCFQDNPTCPTKTMCVCRECFYGTQCQFTTQQFGLSLDAILGYKIRPHLSIIRQSIYVKISIIVASIMFCVGLISGILSILTFQSKPCQKFGCGFYILVSAITSILTITVFNLKLWFLILSQTSTITSHGFLLISCILIEFILRFLLAITDWFHACVAVERLFTVILDINFNVAKSRKMSKLVVFGILLCTSVSLLHDPIHRRLIDDEEEQRTWCLINFKP